MFAQPAEKRHAPGGHSRFNLATRQAVYLDKQQTRLFAGTFANRKGKMADRPFVAAQAPAKAMPKGFNGSKHDESNS
jgi:hypothetical protein